MAIRGAPYNELVVLAMHSEALMPKLNYIRPGTDE
jgi:hypothetical protein